MNKAKLKSYAPQAREDFISAVTARANLLGLSSKAGKLEVSPSQTQGDVTVIAGQAWPAKVDGQRKQLIARIQKDGFDHTMEAVAYTWFNRFAALRFMELHDYLGHGHRALSSTSGGLPDILTYASDLSNTDAGSALPGLSAAKVTELKLAGNRDGELYRMLLVAQCNALSRAMPFLFERIDDDSELLLPDNLLRSDSVIAKLVEEIPEEDWVEVEIIGWLYQFYISEKKEQVIGKVVKSEDIPAATQLFTPNWIVQYLVQNSVGRLWLMANPQSTLAQEWSYYISPAEQTPEVQAQLDALIQTRVREDGDTLNPESITVMDPACGSGHILVVAYDVLKAIYLERGYQARAIPRLILEKNLYGLDIDDRAAQMAGFALLMKARSDDRRLFTTSDEAGNLQPPKLNVLSLQESKGLSVDEITTHLTQYKVQRATIAALVDAFEHAKTFGSLIQIPYALSTHLNLLPEILKLVQKEGDMYARAAAADLLPLVQQAQMLARQFDAVAANPPYMGGKNMNPELKEYIKKKYPGYERDLFGAFIVRLIDLTSPVGITGVMTSFTWMFISSFENLRLKIISERTIASLVQLEYDAFEDAKAHVCTFVVNKFHVNDYLASFIRLVNFKGAENQGPRTLEAIKNPNCGWFYKAKQDNFKKIPGSPITYWVTDFFLNIFEKNKSISQIADPRQGLATGENDTYLRLWFEIDNSNFARDCSTRAESSKRPEKWYPCQKGGTFRKWYGNHEYVVNWQFDGFDLDSFKPRSVIRNPSYYFRPGGTWSSLSSGGFSMRYSPAGFIFESKGSICFPHNESNLHYLIALSNSKVVDSCLLALSPTLDYHEGPYGKIPFIKSSEFNEISKISLNAITIAKDDWNNRETSWDFACLPFVSHEKLSTICDAWSKWSENSIEAVRQMMVLETQNNRLLIEAYGLQDELAAEVPESQITLARADREKDCQRLISYAIGCMMGRYSLDEPGLIYAHAGNVGFKPSRYATFPADTDGIVPITDELWFADDACIRIREFLCAVWGAGNLGRKHGLASREPSQ